jgi:hypothetical protein
MKYDKKLKIKDHTEELEKIYAQRRQWLFASSVVFTTIILVIFGWDYIDSCNDRRIWWVLISLGLLLSVNWWYWTMKSVSTLVRSIYSEYEILNEITSEIEELRIIIKDEFRDQ